MTNMKTAVSASQAAASESISEMKAASLACWALILASAPACAAGVLRAWEFGELLQSLSNNKVLSGELL